jgi:Zn-dependent peptidase ImmA (M78 family)
MIHLDTDMRSDARNWEEALRLQVEGMEESGVLVMRSGIVGNNTHRQLSVEEFRGFALSDPYAPLVFINSRDSKGAQMFTLAHELVHIWLGVSGVSNLEATYAPNHRIERFCNRVAAELLVPGVELRAEWQSVRAQTRPLAGWLNDSKSALLSCYEGCGISDSSLKLNSNANTPKRRNASKSGQHNPREPVTFT